MNERDSGFTQFVEVASVSIESTKPFAVVITTPGRVMSIATGAPHWLRYSNKVGVPVYVNSAYNTSKVYVFDGTKK